jgi:exonuclease III
MDLADVYRIIHTISAQYTVFSAAHEIFSKIDHILGHKASLSKYKKIEIIPCILFDYCWSQQWDLACMSQHLA